jgi:hypothetical protein
MIRPFTIISMLLAAGSGLYLYQAKQQARLLDRQIHDVQEQTAAIRQRVEILRAEYTLLNDPTRLAELAAEHLPDLKPTQPSQWTSLTELDKRLPPVGGAIATPSPLEPATPEETASPERRPIASVDPHSQLPAAVPAHPAATVRTPQPLHPAVTVTHDQHPPVSLRPAGRAIAAAPASPRVSRNAAADVPATPVLATLPAVSRTAQQPSTETGTPIVASALGMARTMMAPVTPANAATLPGRQGGAR